MDPTHCSSTPVVSAKLLLLLISECRSLSHCLSTTADSRARCLSLTYVESKNLSCSLPSCRIAEEIGQLNGLTGRLCCLEDKTAYRNIKNAQAKGRKYARPLMVQF